MIRFLIDQASKARGRIDEFRTIRRWDKLRSKGMHIGKNVHLPLSTHIDTSHCFLISIGDNSGFAENCVILAHDAMPNEWLDATKIGRVIIHESCLFGQGTYILPGVEIGPRVVVGVNSVISSNIPPDSVAMGNPAKVICSLQDYLRYHRMALKRAPKFPFYEYDINYITPEKKKEMIEKLTGTFGYITGGYTAMVRDGKCLIRTKSD